MGSWKVRLADLSDLLRIYTDVDFGTVDTNPSVHDQLPPPGLELVHDPEETVHDSGVPFPYLWAEVRGDDGGLAVGDLYWTPFALFAAHLGSNAFTSHLTQVVKWISVLPGTWADPLAFPIVYEVGKGATMKWLRSTYRGDLGGGVEHFQFHVDLGNPGDDPDIDEAAQLALATTLAATFQDSGADLRSVMSTDVTFVEVGVVQMEATSPTASDGTGGNAAQKNPTQWFAYLSGARPAGAQTGGPLPYEVATCVTLETEHRGPSGRGRIYLPVPGASSMTGGGRFSTFHVNPALTGAQTFLTAIAEDTPYVPVVVSPRRIILNTITSVGVGAVPDSQRRRRRSQDEARLFAPVPA